MRVAADSSMEGDSRGEAVLAGHRSVRGQGRAAAGNSLIGKITSKVVVAHALIKRV